MARSWASTTSVPRCGPGGIWSTIGLVAPFGVLAGQLLVALEPGPVLGDAGAGRHPHPLELAGELLAPRAFLLFLEGQPRLLLFEPRRVIALPGNALAAVELEDPLGDVVEEVAVVGDEHDGAGVFLQVPLEPGDALGVEVVGRLVQEQEVGALEQDLAERDAPAFAAGERARRRRRPAGSRMASMAISMRRSRSQPSAASMASWTWACSSSSASISSASGPSPSRVLISSNRVEVGADRRDGDLDVAAHVERRVEHRLLGQVADRDPRGRPGRPDVVGLDPGHDPQERALARAVAPDHADLGPGIERQPDVLEDVLLAVGLGEVFDGEDILGRHKVSLEFVGSMSVTSSSKVTGSTRPMRRAVGRSSVRLEGMRWSSGSLKVRQERGLRCHAGIPRLRLSRGSSAG